jgi:ABC-type multidrug transport system ATPase subunit
MYASFKSVRDPKKTVKTMMKKFDLKKFRKVQVGNLSGGNKRKLSVACAVIGNPSVMVLDEPSCSMDPLSRKHLWGILSQLKQQDSSVLITTHSMDEAEALSDRIGIMVKGAIKCIGSPNSLRSTLGDDLEIIIKLKRTKKEKIALISRQLDPILGQAVSVNRRDINDCLNSLDLNQERISRKRIHFT